MRAMRPLLLTALLTGACLSACQTPPQNAATRTADVNAAVEGGGVVAPATVAERLLDEPGRRVMRLTNGFTILLQQNKTAPVVAARIYIKAGSLTEQQYMGTGISHVLEHLVAGATSGKRAEAENTLLLQQIGNDSNAYTDLDQTCYFITTSNDKFPVAMDLLVDWTTNTNFTREQFEREYKVVQREIEMGEAEVDRTFYRRTQATRYLQSPARHPVIGYKAAFQKLTYEDCKAYFQQMYVPDNMIISVAGDLDLDEAERVIVEQLKGIRRKSVPSVALPAEPAVTVPRRSVSRADVREARVAWEFPTMDIYNPDLYATDLLATVLGVGESSLLVRKLRDERGLVTEVNAWHPTPTHVQGQLTISAVTKPERILEAQAAVLELLREVQRFGVPPDAVERAKAQSAASLVYGNQTAEQQASRNAADFLIAGDIDFTPRYVARLQAVTPEQVQAVARKYVAEERLLTTVVLPMEAADPFGRAAATQGAVAAAEPLETKRTVLGNGLTVLITRNASAPLVSFHLYSLGGLLAENETNNGVGQAMMAMLERGTGTRSHEQIADFLDGTGTTLSAEAGNNSFLLSAQALKGKAAEAFDLFADVAMRPKFGAEEFGQLRPQLLSGIEQSTEDWFDEGYKHIRETYFAESPYKRMAVGKAEVVSKLTPDDLRKHHARYFLNPRKMVLAISGDVDPATAATWAARFEAIGGSAGETPAFSLRSTPAAARTLTQPTGKESASVMFAFGPGMTVTDADRYAMTVLQTYLGGYSSPGGSKLHDTLRGQGLVYNVQATNFTGPAGGMFLVYTLGEPANVQKILDSVARIVRDVRTGNVTDAAIATAKEQTVTGEKLSKQTIADKSQSAALDELLGLGFDEDEKFPERIRAVTKADVVRVANTYLNTPVIVITTPDAKK